MSRSAQTSRLNLPPRPPPLLPLLLTLSSQAAEITAHEAAGTIEIDGVLDEGAWSRAQQITDFQRYLPTAGGPPGSDTTVRVLYDDRYLYFGITVRNSDVPVRARISPREDINADDQIGLYLDPFRDGQSGYIFYFNGHGIQQDIQVVAGAGNFYWDTLIKSEGVPNDRGYTLEIAFPWRSLKYPRPTGEAQTWGLIVTQKIPAKGEKYSWPITERNHPRTLSQAAPLRGLRPPSRGSGLELIPGITVSQTQLRGEDGELGWNGWTPLDQVVRPSLDLRLGITANTGLAATFNPDFSQVESDETPIDINPRFAFYFAERRTFFLDGSGYFGDPTETLYTRAIVEPLYGAKVTGKEDGWSVGALHTLDRSPTPSVHEGGTAGFDHADGALSSAVRLRRDAFGRGHLGILWTDKRITDGFVATGTANDVLGLDAYVPLAQRWGLTASSLQSVTTHEGDLTWGADNMVQLDRSTGVETGFHLSIRDRTPGLRKELAFLTQSGITNLASSINHTFEPRGAVDTVRPSVGMELAEERQGDHAHAIGTSTEVLVRGVHTIGLGGGVRSDREGTAEADGWYVEAAYTGETGPVFSYAPSASVTRALDYILLVPATRTRGDLTTTFRPSPGLWLDTTLRGELLDADGQLENAQLVRAKLNAQFTRQLGLRLIGEWSDGTDLDPQLLSSALVTWLLHPGTTAYLSYAEQTSLALDSPVPVERTLFAKATVLLRP